jgi:fermentation-respiration switch protein FrsA (DUF1100 family)
LGGGCHVKVLMTNLENPSTRLRFLRRERLIGLAVALLIGFGLFVYGLRWIESSITYHPVKIGPADKVQLPPGANNVWFTTKDGVRLHGWFFPSKRTPIDATVVYFHGNGGNISNIGWMGERLSTNGFDVLLFDYRGYGESAGAANAESGLYADGDAALDFLIDEKQLRAEQIVLYGHSLGTTVAADVAARRTVGAVILESGLSSASSVASTALPWLPSWLHFLGKNRFESARKLSAVQVPVLIVHGDRDEVIPFNEGKTLFAAANEPKQLLIVPGGDHNLMGAHCDRYLSDVEQFIRDAVKD